MSAKQLEDFIRVIETAEKMSNRPESSIWSYPTDVFTRTSLSPRRHAPPKPSPPPSVPRLWDPKISSELLSSSWGSRSSCKSTPGSTSATSATATSKSKLTTVRSAATSTSMTSARKSRPEQKAPVVLEERKDFNTLMNMQRHNRFARRVAKDLLSSMSPTNSPRPARKAASSKSPSSGRRSTAASKSPSAKVTTPAQTTPIIQKQPSPKDAVKSSNSSSSREKSMSPQKHSTASSSSVEEVFTSPKEPVKRQQEVSPRKALARSITIKPAEENESITEQDLVEEPRPLPRARPRVNIKEDVDQAKETKKKQQPVIRRPKSAPTPKKEQQQPSVDLRSYSKSFKLLGLDIPSNRTEATKVETINVDIKTKLPTMRTRLKERTGSVSDLRQIVDDSKHHMLPKEDFGKIKTNLSNAIFEEWYFTKLQELADKERQAKEKAESEALAKEREAEEKKKKAAIEYQKWLEGKQKQLKKMKAKVRGQCQVELEERKAKILKAEEEWKSKKAEEHKKYLRLQRRLQKKQEQEMEKQRLKKEEAVGKFNQWQEEWKQKIKAKIVQDKKKKLEEIEANRAEAKEKKEAAELAFNAWKAKKVEDRKKGTTVAASTGQSANNQTKKSSQRLEAARDAYDNWLEYVEQREEEERFAEEERVLREMWRPPWYPPGIAEF